MRAPIVLLSFGLLAGIASATPAAGTGLASADATTRGTLVLRPNPDALARWHVRVDGGLALDDTLRFGLSPRAALDVELGDGGPTRIGDTPIALPGFALRRDDGGFTPTLSLQSDAGSVQQWNIVDDAGRTWLRISQAMRAPDGRALQLFTADLRAGPALAQWLGTDIDGQLFANVQLDLPLRAAAAKPASASNEKSCNIPNWPGTPGFITDVILTNMDAVDVMRCRNLGAPGQACDGPGGTQGEVVIVPSVTLRNSDAPNASEVPWYTKFTGNFAPYGNDQHPFLVWNLYRIDADGRIGQIARSGLKHAFATANTHCVEACGNSHILGRGCEDLYNSFSNDANNFLSPRREVIPSRGVWGRCGSVFDDGLNAMGAGTPGCNSIEDPPPANDSYRERLVVRETGIDPALNPGATFFIDAWYVVRDDGDLFNTMGYRSIAPAFVNGFWRVNAGQGPFVPGSVVDAWLERAPPGAWRERRELLTPEGRVVIGTRVERLPDLRYRYDYAVFNYDLTRPVTSGAEPDLRIERNAGLSQLRLALQPGTVVTDAAFGDGDSAAGNDWVSVIDTDGIAWTAPNTAAALEWGQLVTLRVESASAPGHGELRVTPVEPGTPATYATALPAPDATLLFRDGFDP